MIASPQAERITTRDDGNIVLTMSAQFKGGEEADFYRADLVISGIRHEGPSYKVRIFLNNSAADAGTACVPETGYVGQFSVFGHGGCFGGVAHCDITGAPTDTRAGAVATARPHPLTPKRKVVTITEQLKRVLSDQGGVNSITFVPILTAPKRSECGPVPGIFQFDEATIRTYR